METLSTQTRFIAVVGMLILGLTLEAWRPLRKTTRPKVKRAALNLTLALLGALVLRFTVVGPLAGLSHQVFERSWGLLAWIPGARQEGHHGLTWLGVGIGVLLLDYTLYLWHAANHRVAFLWRFHNVHHVDQDMDVTTASRFHVGELLISGGYRAGQIVLFGIDPFTLVLFETLVTAAAQFHHTNVRLPAPLERVLGGVIVTPRMHGLHHSWRREETDSNFSTIFSFWDRLHRSLSAWWNRDRPEVTIGVPAYTSPQETESLRGVLTLPFGKPRPW